MKHIPESELALYAGGDLAWWPRLRAERHVRACSRCQEVSAGYSEFRLDPALPASLTPGASWTRMASEMKANIHLGLAAGECVSLPPSPRSYASGRGQRLVLAGSLLASLAAMAAWVGSSDWRLFRTRATTGVVLEASESGIQVRGTRQTLRILNRSARNVVYTVGSQGELRARSLDPETGNVSITHVYGE